MLPPLSNLWAGALPVVRAFLDNPASDLNLIVDRLGSI